ncbi:MAG: YegP family protein [Bacteroidota bacterium]
MKTQNTDRRSALLERFELLSNKNGHFFQYKDLDGNILLRSKDYQSAQSRDRGMKIVLKNATDARKYEIKKADKDYFYLLKGGNHQPIARSGMFNTKSEAAQAMNLFVKEALGFDKEAQSVEKEAQQTAEVKAFSNRFSFRIDLYKGEDEQEWRGKIEYPLDKSKLAFQGIDEKAIVHFIKSHLPDAPTIGKVETKEIASPKENENKVATAKQPKKEKAIPNESQKKESSSPKAIEIKGMNLLKNGILSTNNIIEKAEVYNLGIEIAEKRSLNYSIRVFAKSLEHPQILQVGASNGKLEEENNIYIPLLLQSLSEGTFRLSATTVFTKSDKKMLAESSCYVQLI